MFYEMPQRNSSSSRGQLSFAITPRRSLRLLANTHGRPDDLKTPEPKSRTTRVHHSASPLTAPGKGSVKKSLQLKKVGGRANGSELNGKLITGSGRSARLSANVGLRRSPRFSGNGQVCVSRKSLNQSLDRAELGADICKLDVAKKPNNRKKLTGNSSGSNADKSVENSCGDGFNGIESSCFVVSDEGVIAKRANLGVSSTKKFQRKPGKKATGYSSSSNANKCVKNTCVNETGNSCFEVSEEVVLAKREKLGAPLSKKCKLGKRVKFNSAASSVNVRIEKQKRTDIDKGTPVLGKRKRDPIDGSPRIVQGWTKDQELALQRAYFAAKPTPHFWKMVSKLVTDQDMEDTYQAPFKSCVEEGKASCLMCSYNAVNGIPACAREDLLQKTRDKWGFKGYITSDCDAVATIFEYQNYTKSPEDAVALSLRAGMDINCGTYLLRHTQAAIDQGKVTEKDIDRALFNLFSVQLRLGLFDGNPINRQFGNLGPQHVCTSEHKALALEAAKQGIVLLKNVDKFLPLRNSSISSLAIIGPMANTTKLGGGYTGVPCSQKSLLDAFQEYGKKTSYASGCLDDVPCNSNAGFPEALSIARDADIVIVVVGLDLSQETEDHDRYSLLLPGCQMDLVTAIAAVSKQPLVLVLTGGGPLDISFAEGDPRISSILWIGYPGETGGKALVDVIFGDYNPGGKLPVTWYPESFTSIPMNDMNMRADPSRGYPGRTYRFYTGDIIYGFGHGLSYTRFTYKLLSAPTILSLSRSIKSRKNLIQRRGYDLNYIPVDELAYCDLLTFHVHISVLNSGDMDGSHVVMLYSRVPDFMKGAPEKQLIGFDRVQTFSYRTTETSIMIDPCKHLSIANDDGKRILPLGDHVLMLSDLEHIVSVEL